MEKRRKFFEHLLEEYQIILFKKKSIEEIFSLKANLLKGIIVLFFLVGFLFWLVFLSIEYTPLKKYISSFQDNASKRKIIRLFQQVDSLEQDSKILEQYITQIHPIFSKNIDELKLTKPNINRLQLLYKNSNLNVEKSNTQINTLQKKIKILQRQLNIKELEVAELSKVINAKDTLVDIAKIDKNLDSIIAKELAASAKDLAFRNELDRQSNFNLLSFEKVSEPLIFFPPSKGKIASAYNTAQKKWSVKITSTQPFIKSVLSGRVVLIAKTLQHGNVVMINHSQNYTSVYKNVHLNGLQEGDWVERKGQSLQNLLKMRILNFNYGRKVTLLTL